jgi:hypothetical protein
VFVAFLFCGIELTNPSSTCLLLIFQYFNSSWNLKLTMPLCHVFDSRMFLRNYNSSGGPKSSLSGSWQRLLWCMFLALLKTRVVFNLVSYLKSKVHNCLKCHLQLVVAVYAHTFFTLDSFPYKAAYDILWANVQSRTCWGHYAWIVKLFVCPSFPWHVGRTLPLYRFTGLFFSCVCENLRKTETLLMEDNLLAFFILFQKNFVMSFAALG